MVAVFEFGVDGRDGGFDGRDFLALPCRNGSDEFGNGEEGTSSWSTGFGKRRKKKTSTNIRKRFVSRPDGYSVQLLRYVP